MIEINLLPGAGKKRASRSAGASINFAALAAGVSARVQDKFLAAAVASVIVAAVSILGMYTYQNRHADALSAAERKARGDSAHYATVLADKVHSEAKRDTLLRELNIIKSIDDDRFVWPHILDEISRSLPPYTWLTSVAFAGTPQGTVNAAALPAKPAAKPKNGKAPRLVTEVPQDSVQVRVAGRTVDIQALTRFMKDLEASPFLDNVQLEKSEMVIEGGQQVTQFSLTMLYTRPDTTLIQRVALSGEAQ